MAVNSYDATTGYPKFADGDAPDIKADPQAAALYASQVGTRPILSTAARTAYAYARKGLEVYDTDLDEVYLHNGSGWVLWHKRPTSYTPTATNVTGSPTTVARYAVHSGVAHVEIEVTLVGTNIGSNPQWSIPVTAASSNAMAAGWSRMLDASASTTALGSVLLSGGNAILAPVAANGTYATFQSATSTIPFTWASGDVITMNFNYAVA